MGQANRTERPERAARTREKARPPRIQVAPGKAAPRRPAKAPPPATPSQIAWLREQNRHEERIYLFIAVLVTFVLAAICFLGHEKILTAEQTVALIGAILAGLGLGGIGKSFFGRRKD